MKIKFIFYTKDHSEIGDQTFDSFPCVPRPGDIFDSSHGNLTFDSGGVSRFVVSSVVYRFINNSDFLPVVACVEE